MKSYMAWVQVKRLTKFSHITFQINLGGPSLSPFTFIDVFDRDTRVGLLGSCLQIRLLQSTEFLYESIKFNIQHLQDTYSNHIAWRQLLENTWISPDCWWMKLIYTKLNLTQLFLAWRLCCICYHVVIKDERLVIKKKSDNADSVPQTRFNKQGFKSRSVKTKHTKSSIWIDG